MQQKVVTRIKSNNLAMCGKGGLTGKEILLANTMWQSFGRIPYIFSDQEVKHRLWHDSTYGVRESWPEWIRLP